MEGWKVNHKRVQRLWREEGLRVPPHSPKRRRVGNSTVPARRLQAERPNQVWALDFIFDTTADGRPFKVLSMCDEFTGKAWAAGWAARLPRTTWLPAGPTRAGVGRSRVPPLRQRTRIRCRRPSRLVPLLWHRHQLH